MCRLLAELTHTDKRLMAETIRRLEHKSGLPNVDIKLTSDIHTKLHLKIRALGLDPHDTTNIELYKALQNMVKIHEDFIKKLYNLPKNQSPDEFASDVALIYEKLRFNRRCWVVRQSVIRRILKTCPPKTLVKHLGYRTAESLIKREPTDVLMFLALKIESVSWQQQFYGQIKKLTSIDFEERLIDVVALDNIRYKSVTKIIIENHKALVFEQPLMGTIFIFSASQKITPGLLLLSLLMSLKKATDLQFAHSHLRHYQMSGDFGTKVVDTLLKKHKKTVTIASQPFTWDIVHRHYGTSNTINHPEVFQPHLQPDDLAYRRAEEILYKAEPALHFWHGIEYVGMSLSDGLLSFNIIDVLINLVNGLGFEDRHSSHLISSVWDELQLRYLKQPAIENELVMGLNTQDSLLNNHTYNMEFV